MGSGYNINIVIAKMGSSLSKSGNCLNLALPSEKYEPSVPIRQGADGPQSMSCTASLYKVIADMWPAMERSKIARW